MSMWNNNTATATYRYQEKDVIEKKKHRCSKIYRYQAIKQKEQSKIQIQKIRL